jgi:hypothetical protein
MQLCGQMMQLTFFVITKVCLRCAIGDDFRPFYAHCLLASSFSQFTNENAKDSNLRSHYGSVALFSNGPSDPRRRASKRLVVVEIGKIAEETKLADQSSGFESRTARGKGSDSRSERGFTRDSRMVIGWSTNCLTASIFNCVPSKSTLAV